MLKRICAALGTATLSLGVLMTPAQASSSGTALPPTGVQHQRQSVTVDILGAMCVTSRRHRNVYDYFPMGPAYGPWSRWRTVSIFAGPCA